MRIRITGSRCPCGALATGGSGTCEKCAARHRWMRRKSHRRHDA